MQIKDRKKLLILFILSLLAFKTTIIKADEFLPAFREAVDVSSR